MNVQDMTDAEIYEAERQKRINDDTTDVKTIVKRIQEKQKPVVPENVKLKLTPQKIRRIHFNAAYLRDKSRLPREPHRRADSM